MTFKINDKLTASGQITLADLNRIKAAGFKTVVTARPDGEMPGQLTAAEVKTAARALGLDHAFVPVQRGQTPSIDDGRQLARLMNNGPVFAYCGAGPRIAILYAVAAASAGLSADDVVREVGASGLQAPGLSSLMRNVTAAAA